MGRRLVIRGIVPDNNTVATRFLGDIKRPIGPSKQLEGLLLPRIGLRQTNGELQIIMIQRYPLKRFQHHLGNFFSGFQAGMRQAYRQLIIA